MTARHSPKTAAIIATQPLSIFFAPFRSPTTSLSSVHCLTKKHNGYYLRGFTISRCRCYPPSPGGLLISLACSVLLLQTVTICLSCLLLSHCHQNCFLLFLLIIYQIQPVATTAEVAPLKSPIPHKNHFSPPQKN